MGLMGETPVSKASRVALYSSGNHLARRIIASRLASKYLTGTFHGLTVEHGFKKGVLAQPPPDIPRSWERNTAEYAAH
jgi:hypothetical protein